MVDQGKAGMENTLRAKPEDIREQYERQLKDLQEAYGEAMLELRALSFVEWAERQNIALRFIQPGKPNQNAFIERFNKSYRQEVLDANLFNTPAEVQAATDDWIEDYNLYRPHDALGRVPPAQYLPRLQTPNVSTSKL